MSKGWRVSVYVSDGKIDVSKSHYFFIDERFGSESHCGLMFDTKTLVNEAEAQKILKEPVPKCKNCEKAFGPKKI